MTYEVGNPGPGLGHAKTYEEVKPVKGIPTTSVDNCISLSCIN